MDVNVRFCDGGGGGDRETDVAGALFQQPPSPEEDPYLPPESFEVRIGGDGIDWTDLNAVFDRDDSTKGSTNPKSSQANPKARSISERPAASLNAKPPVIGLPTSGFAARPARRPPTGRIFPKKRARPGGAGGQSAVEPGSPQVSCLGKVLSDRERTGSRKHGRGWRWMWCFTCGGGGAAGEGDGRRGSPPMPADADRASSQEEQSGGLGMMRQFASGRRAASWWVEEEAEGQVRHRHPKRAAEAGVEVEHNGGGIV